MHRSLKRFCSLVLSVLLIFVECVPVFAWDEPVAPENSSAVSADEAEETVSDDTPVSSPLPAQPVPTPVAFEDNDAAEDILTASADVSDILIHLGGRAEYADEAELDLASNADEAAKQILEGLQLWSEEIDITSLKIASDDIASIFAKTVNSHPELFYVTGGFEYSYNYEDDTVCVIYPEYSSSYTTLSVETFNAKVDEILENVKSAATDLEKLIIIHDYIIKNCEYDLSQVKPGVTDAYGCLVNGLAVCHGYSEAFMYLAGKVGIKGQVVSSLANDHAWNIISLGGKWFYVDVTWDDPIGTDEFYCRYINFLRSRDGMKDTGHVSDDWIGAIDGVNVYSKYAGANTYDSFFWSDMIRPIPLAGGMALYYGAGKLNIYDLSKNSTKQYTPQGGSCTSITAVAGVFYYSTVSSIYSLTTAGKMAKCYSLNSTESSYGGIYELTALSYGVRYHIMKAAYTEVLHTGVYIIDGLPIPSGVITPSPTRKPTTTPTKAPTATPTAKPTAVPTATDDKLEIRLADGNEYIYTGSAVKPVVNVFYRGKTLRQDVDYTLKYRNNVNAGAPAAVEISGVVLGFCELREFSILPKDISAADVTVFDIDIQAGEKLPQPSMYYGSIRLGKNDISYDSSQVFETDGILTVSGNGNFCGERNIRVKVSDEKKRSIKVTLEASKRNYTGQDQKLSASELKVYDVQTGDELINETDYVVVYPMDLCNAGIKKVRIIGVGEYGGCVEKSYKILPKTDGKISVGVSNAKDIEYSPVGAHPDISVKVDGITLEGGRDYKIKYSANKKVGTGKYTISFTGNYKGRDKIKRTFTISAAKLETGTAILVPDMAFIKDGKYISKPYIVKDERSVASSQLNVSYYFVDKNGEEQPLEKNRKITEADLNEKGELTVYVIAEGKKNYTGTVKGSYIVRKADNDHDISKAKVSIVNKTTGKKITQYAYTGEKIIVDGDDEIVVTIGKDKTVLIPGKDYTVEYINNVNKGKAVIVIKGKGDYAGSKKSGFKIIRKKA